MDRRDGELKISSSPEETDGISKIYTDGFFAHDTGMSGYGGIIQMSDGEEEVFCRAAFPDSEERSIGF